ncbi:MAG: MBL fold metallo-hydrolase [Deltaproteobacteria bacterium]|nr:MBL fold metallo-hydrolase [Deltaproteobacteria bacterium]
MAVHYCGNNLYLIDLDLPLEGFRKFISAWLYTPPGLAIVVDPGPAATIPVLISALKEHGVNRLDYILLTHIHADHAGGAGLLAKHFPEARIICHSQGIRHMIDPKKLWEGTQKTLGDVAKAYGAINAVPADRIGFKERIQHDNVLIEAFETPGHAPHHLCYHCGDILFAGEVAGVIYPFEDGGFYRRPATPPVFDDAIFRRSLIKTSTLEASLICLGHYGFLSGADAETFFSIALDQLTAWLGIVGEWIRKDETASGDHIFADLLKRDPCLSRYPDLPPDIQARECYFSANSIRGIREYLSRLDP